MYIYNFSVVGEKKSDKLSRVKIKIDILHRNKN